MLSEQEILDKVKNAGTSGITIGKILEDQEIKTYEKKSIRNSVWKVLNKNAKYRIVRRIPSDGNDTLWGWVD